MPRNNLMPCYYWPSCIHNASTTKMWNSDTHSGSLLLKYCMSSLFYFSFSKSTYGLICWICSLVSTCSIVTQGERLTQDTLMQRSP